MKIDELKQRLDPKCWTGKKIGNPKTKVKGGVRVNNCVPAESVAEAAPPGAKAERMVKHIKAGYAKDGKLTDVEKRKAFGAAWKAHNKGVTEGARTSTEAIRAAQKMDRNSFVRFATKEYRIAAEAAGRFWDEVKSGAEFGTMTEGEERVDTLVTKGLGLMRGPTWLDAVAAIKYQVGERDYRERKEFYDFFVKQLVDRYGKKGVAEEQLGEIGDTPAGRAALGAVQNRAYGTMDAWSANPTSGYSSTPKDVRKATSAAVAAGNRLHGFGPDNSRENTVMARDALRQKQALRQTQGVAEVDMNRRGFLKGLGAAAVAGAGLGAMGSAQAGGATTEYMQAYTKAKSKFEAGYDISQVARALGVSGPNNNMVGPMGGEWGAINKAAQEMGVRNQDAPVAPPTQSRPSAEKQNPVTAEYQRLSIMALRFSLTNPKFEQEYAPIETRRNHTMDTLINGTSGKLSANPAIAQRQRIAIAQYMDDANSEYIQKTTALLKQYGALKEQGVAEDFNGEYDDEAGMADNNLETLARAVEGIDDLIQSGDNLPEWCQEKIAVAKSMLVAVWDYMASEEDSDEVDPEVDEMFEAMDQLAEQLAAKHRVSADTVWESFEALDDRMLYETAAWRRKEGKSKSGGLNAKGVASYRRENPGSKLQTAVTTKPSKLKPGSKAAKRRKSFCARMSGVKGPMKKPNGKPTRKALALRKWNC